LVVFPSSRVSLAVSTIFQCSRTAISMSHVASPQHIQGVDGPASQRSSRAGLSTNAALLRQVGHPPASLANSCVPVRSWRASRNLVASHTPISSALLRAELYSQCPRSSLALHQRLPEIWDVESHKPPGRSVREKGERLRRNDVHYLHATAHIFLDQTFSVK